VYVDRPRRRWIARGELNLRVLFQPGCSSSRLQARPPNLPRVRRPDAASGDVLRWLDDERVLPTGLAGAAWF
jgi:hypothetical protein